MANPGPPTTEELQRLPRRALAAYAVRLARRVQPLFSLPDDASWYRHYQGVERALRLVERYASGDNIAADAYEYGAINAGFALDPPDAAGTAAVAAGASLATRAAAVAYTAAVAATADAADLEAFAAAFDTAFDTASFTAGAARSDYDNLLILITHNTENQDIIINLSGNVPLGSLWPHGEPPWYSEALSASRERLQRVSRSLLAERPTETAGATEERLIVEATICEFVDHDDAVEAILDFHRALNEYHIAGGGNGLVIDDWKLYSRAGVPAGVV